MLQISPGMSHQQKIAQLETPRLTLEAEVEICDFIVGGGY